MVALGLLKQCFAADPIRSVLYSCLPTRDKTSAQLPITLLSHSSGYCGFGQGEGAEDTVIDEVLPEIKRRRADPT